MKNAASCLLSALILAVPLSSFAKGHPATGGNKVITHPDSPEVAAKKNFDQAQADCARARVAYEDKAFAQGAHDEKELRGLGNAKDSSCRQALGAHTQWLNALNAARGSHFTARSAKQLQVNAAAKKKKAEEEERARAELDAENDAIKELDAQIKEAKALKPGDDGKKKP